jgi:hypothetical protein
MAAGFSEALGLALAPAELSVAELALAAQLARDQFGDPTWTERV